MNCFSHSDVVALAICTHCGIGLCSKCMLRSNRAVACSDDCAAEIAAANNVAQFVERAMRLQNEAPRFIAGFLFVCGAGLIAFGAAFDDPELLLLTWGFGALFVLFGAAAYWVWRRHVRSRPTEHGA
jgi:hypothetical protein